MSSEERRQAFRSSLLEWSENNLRRFSWRDTTDPYEVLVAEILLAKTFAEKVEPIYDRYIVKYPSIDELAEAQVTEVANLIEPLGLQNKRSEALVQLGEQLEGKKVPNDKEELLELPYVGKYAANATLCFAFERARPILDANVTRVYNRAFDLDLESGSTEAWDFAERMLPEDDVRRYNLALLDFSAKICAPKAPNCKSCFFTNNCVFYSENI